MKYAINVHLIDPHASPNEVAAEYRMTLMDTPSNKYDAVIVAVGHDEYRALTLDYFRGLMNGAPILLDLKGLYSVPTGGELTYWRL
jgi:UDP-N-acetyl-D-galactosamine dehydrogenase